VEKYKNLVYSIALKYGAKPDDAADIFQTVWVTVYSELVNLKKQGSIRSWLITITRRQCYHWKQKQVKERGRRPRGDEQLALETAGAVDPVALDELERQQLVREAIGSLTDRCRQIVKLLFFSDPPLKYREVAERLGLAVGSIGFTRERCLKQLRRALVTYGVA
jgi:RNA polymerase sigma factor (sigma-70 family)